jgi:hypothetical protein
MPAPIELDAASIKVPASGLGAVDADDMTRMLHAVAGDHAFEAAGVEDTPANRKAFAVLQAESHAIPDGQDLDIPFFD